MVSGGVRRGVFGPTAGAGARPEAQQAGEGAGPAALGAGAEHRLTATQGRPRLGRSWADACPKPRRSGPAARTHRLVAATHRCARARPAPEAEVGGRTEGRGGTWRSALPPTRRAGPRRGGAGSGGCCRERRSRGDPRGFVREGLAVFPQRRREQTPKAQKLIFIGKTQNKQPLPPHLQARGRRAKDLHLSPICTLQNPPGEGAPIRGG